MAKMAHDVRSIVISRAAWGGSQNFLGARWVECLVNFSPNRYREEVALRCLSLSPHYFYDRDIQAEAERNRRSRAALADIVIAPYLSAGSRVLDYGCGPGYLARAVAGRAAHVTAVDISRGVLACAKVLNSDPRITYQTPGELRGRPPAVDLAYSFAVFQHLTTPVAADALGLIAAAMRPGGQLLLHFAVPGPDGWRTEAEWRGRGSLAGRARLRYGLNCFGRPAAEMAELVARQGFSDITVAALGDRVSLPGDDVGAQHLLTARRQRTEAAATAGPGRAR